MNHQLYKYSIFSMGIGLSIVNWDYLLRQNQDRQEMRAMIISIWKLLIRWSHQIIKAIKADSPWRSLNSLSYIWLKKKRNLITVTNSFRRRDFLNSTSNMSSPKSRFKHQRNHTVEEERGKLLLQVISASMRKKKSKLTILPIDLKIQLI